MKTLIKIVKPIKYDIHFEYICPALCGNKHWLSLKECQEKRFRVVCDCGLVFKPKRIIDITINYDIKPKPETEEQVVKKTTVIIDDLPIPTDNDFDLDTFLEDCIVTLCSFGFEKSEAKQLLKNSYSKNPTKNSAKLIKQTLLDNFGGNHE